MASIYPKRKDGKIISFKFKTFLGRDSNGKQLFKCTTWTPPPKPMAESKLIAQAEKQAILWEQRAIAEYNASKSVKASTLIGFEDFVNRIWFPNQMNEKEHRASTIAFHSYVLKVVLPRLGDKQLQKITTKDIEDYLNYLKNTYRTAQNKSLSPKTIRHHYATMNLIFEYAVKIDYIIINNVEITILLWNRKSYLFFAYQILRADRYRSALLLYSFDFRFPSANMRAEKTTVLSFARKIAGCMTRNPSNSSSRRNYIAF